MAHAELFFGSTPTDVTPLQLGTKDYTAEGARAEARRTIELITALFGPPPASVMFRIAPNAHDFGTYYDIRCVFDEHDDLAQAYAYAVDADFPRTWEDDRKRDWRAGAGIDAEAEVLDAAIGILPNGTER